MSGKTRKSRAEAIPDRSIGDLVLRKRSDPGTSPGTLRIDPNAPPPTIRVIAYGPERLDEGAIERVADLRSWLDGWPVVWVSVDGLGSAEVLQEIADLFEFHRLVLEDVVNVHQRPKVEEYDDEVFVVARTAKRTDLVATEQVSLYLRDRVLLTFSEREQACFEPVRQRIRRASGRIRQRGVDYLAYAVLDAVVDANFPLLEAFGEELVALEDETLRRPGSGTVARIHDVKRELLMMRRTIWPLREMFNSLMRDSTPLIQDETKVYLRDCYDHTVQLVDIVETYRELAFGLMDVYLSGLSHRMNEVMKVLTIIATIFIPLTFIAGIYGMNFNSERSPWNMPELAAYYGYPICLAAMLLVGVGMLFYFRRIGWLGRSEL